jgi:hypothetical protein
VDKREELIAILLGMDEAQLDHVEPVLRAAVDPFNHTVAPESDFATDEFGLGFGVILRAHYVVSNESFTKDKFEHAMVKVLKGTGHEAKQGPRGLPGRDLDVDDERWSLKTQANASIRADEIHISKFMELGRGPWEVEADLEGLREQMFQHMEGYDRIFTLRCLSQNTRRVGGDTIEYELVEIPKPLLLRAADFPCRMHMGSTQTPKPGSCAVLDDDGLMLFDLYFDAGGERKLQVRHLAKSACIVHATWTFTRPA